MKLLRLLPVLLPIVVGVSLRLALVIAVPDVPLHGDELDFVQGARELLAGQDVSFFPFRPPAYIAFVAGVLGLSGDSPDAVRMAQGLLDGLTILGLFLLGSRALGRRVGLVAAWIYAFYPEAIAYSSYLWSETLAQLLLIWGLLALVALRERPARGCAMATGLLWGVLALVKPFQLYLLPLLVAWLVIDTPRGSRGPMLRAGALVVGLTLVTITPWSVVQSVREGKPVLICTTGAKNLTSGVNYAPPPQFDFASPWDISPEERASYPKREVGVVAFILQEPGLFLERAVQKMSYLWSPNSSIIRYLYVGFPPDVTTKYGHPKRMAKGLRLGIVGVTLVSNILLTLGLAMGILLSRERLLGGLAAIGTLAYMGMITLTPALSRYRLPLMLFATLYSALLLSGRADTQRLQRPAVMTGACIALLCLVVLWSMRLPEILELVW